MVAFSISPLMEIESISFRLFFRSFMAHKTLKMLFCEIKRGFQIHGFR
jgi:hypothetical protein